jgi:hypothetical protein
MEGPRLSGAVMKFLGSNWTARPLSGLGGVFTVRSGPLGGISNPPNEVVCRQRADADVKRCPDNADAQEGSAASALEEGLPCLSPRLSAKRG